MPSADLLPVALIAEVERVRVEAVDLIGVVVHKPDISARAVDASAVGANQEVGAMDT